MEVHSIDHVIDVHTDDGVNVFSNTVIGADELISKVQSEGQGHVLRWWDTLSEESRERLSAQLRGIDFDSIRDLRETLQDYIRGGRDLPQLDPPEIIPVPGTPEQRAEAEEVRRAGEEAIRRGRTAAFLVAGGQGTRLGYDGPKGLYPIGPVSNKTLFQMHAEKIIAASRHYGVIIPWMIMTSGSNDLETRRYFEEQNYFGMSKDDVIFFSQRMLPALDAEGKLLLDAKDHLFMNPNGHGGSLLALVESGALNEMRKRGVDCVSYFQVDNVLIRIIDPLFIGYHILHGSQMSSKMVPKRNASEKVGVFARIDGRLRVIEYSDMRPEELEAALPDGRLKYRAGSIAIHLLDLSFVESEVKDGFRLPYHVAHKKIPVIDANGDRKTPEEPNGFKFETFVFDALADAERAVVMEVVREEEFSPVKNKRGEDSPATARRDLTNYFGRWLEAAGIRAPGSEDGRAGGHVEISPLYAMDQETFIRKAPKNLVCSRDIYLGPE